MFRAVFVALDELKVTPLAVSLPTGTHDLFLTLRAGDADAVAAKLSHALLWEGRARVAQSIERLDRCALVRVALHAPRPSILGELLAALARHDLHPLASAQGASHGVGLVLAEDVSHRALEVLHGAFLT
jgi:BioD-like phosphotransacetylase family protein